MVTAMTVTHLHPDAPDDEPGEFERIPPHDFVAEQSVLGGMLLSKDAPGDVIDLVAARDFYRPAHEAIYDAIVDLYSRGEPSDAVTVADELTKRGDLARVGGPAYLHTLLALVPTAANVAYYARIVRERAVLRRLVTAGTRIAHLGYAAEGGHVDEIVNRAQVELHDVTAGRTDDDITALGDVTGAVLDAVEAAGKRDGATTGVPTGFAQLDLLTHGLQAGEMVIVAARPAVGKSTFAVDIVRHATIRLGLTAAIFSLEMSRTEIVTRALAAEAGITTTTLQRGSLREPEWERLADTEHRISSAPLFIDDNPNTTIPKIRAKCRRMKQRGALDLVVIDYLQLMTSGKKVENRQQEVSEFSRSVKLLAKELELPVIVVSQLNRGSEQRADKRPQLSDLRESGSLEQDADMVILLHREDMYLKESPRAGEADVIVAKNRRGPLDTIVVTFQGHYSRFVDFG